jgi:hypothetical protein
MPIDESGVHREGMVHIMPSRAARFPLAVALSLGLMVGSLAPAFAVPKFGPAELYFPWVPWGVVIEDPDDGSEAGPFYSYLTIQNLEGVPINLRYEPASIHAPEGPSLVTLSPLQPNASQSISAGELFDIDEASTSAFGGGVKVTATRQSDDLPARIAGVMRQMSPTPSPYFSGLSTSAQVTVSGYTGLSEIGIAEEVFLPIVQTNNNWNTLIRATNFDEAAATLITVMLHEAGGGGSLGPAFQITQPGETATFDLRGLGIPEGWVGTAEITAGVPIGAVAERIKIETNMLLMNVSRSSEQTAESNYAALIFRDWNSWNTGISIANLANVDNEVEIDFFDIDGNPVHDESITIPANGMDFVYLPAGDGSPFVGSAVITGSEAFHGVVDEVKYLGNDGDTGHAMSYTLDYLLALDGDALAFPRIARGIDGSGDTSGVQIFNPTAHAADLEISFYTTMGAIKHVLFLTLGAGESYTAYTLFYPEIGDGFLGNAVVFNQPGNGAIVAVSNIVNYDVQFDGSASFNATRFAVFEAVVVLTE